MWWSRKKYIESKTPSVEKQVSRLLEIKSVTVPQAEPTWNLHYKRNERWDSRLAVNEGFNASPVVYICVEKRAKLFSSVPWFVERKLSDGTYERVENTPLNELIENPNPDMSWLELMHETSQQLDLAGTCFWSKIKAGVPSLPYELWLMHENKVKIKPGKDRLIKGYLYTSGANEIPIKAEDMLRIRNPNPNDYYHGMPVLMAAAKSTDIDVEMGRWQKSSFENRNTADIHVEVPVEMQAAEIDHVREKLKERGGSDHAREPIVSSGKINHLSRSAVELDFSGSKKNVWAEICAAFSLSMSALGFTENVNLSNADAMERQVWDNAIIPNLNLARAQLNRGLARDFGKEYRLNYDLSGVKVLQEDLGVKIDNATKLYSMGFSIQAINKKLELEFDEADLPDDEPLNDDIEEAEADNEAIDSDEISDDVKALLKSVGYGE